MLGEIIAMLNQAIIIPRWLFKQKRSLFLQASEYNIEMPSRGGNRARSLFLFKELWALGVEGPALVGVAQLVGGSPVP